MSWIYIEREQYVRMSDKLGVSDDVRNSIKNWAVTVSNKSETPRLKVVFRTENNRYEAWSAGIPNPDSNKGKSGGYRLVYFLDLTEKTINLDYVELRKNMGFKNEGGKKKDKYNDYVRDLKKVLRELC